MQTIFLMWQMEHVGLSFKSWLANMDTEIRHALSKAPKAEEVPNVRGPFV